MDMFSFDTIALAVIAVACLREVVLRFGLTRSNTKIA